MNTSKEAVFLGSKQETEKIEELTLYSIQLEKQNQRLQATDKRQQITTQQQQVEIDELKRLVKRLALANNKPRH